MNMSEQSLEFISDDNAAGFRLWRLEVLNWGTFTQRIWKLDSGGANTLLTGNIGSGKSTIADAIITLLVPPRKIVYNKAAGAELRERTAASYVLGGYKSLKNELTNKSEPIFLREPGNYSVILGHFYNAGYLRHVTLAQVFQSIDQKEVKRFFVVSTSDLNIKEHFTDFGNDLSKLKKRLKSLPDTNVIEQYHEYSSRFRRLFGIKSEKALELFNQTVSMKSVGSLNDFVRNHMIEKSDAASQVEELKKNFDNLIKSYEAVQRVKAQMSQLQPIVKDADDYEIVNSEIRELRLCKEILPVFIAKHQVELLKISLQNSMTLTDKTEQELDEFNRKLEQLREQMQKAGIEIDNNKEGRQLKLIEDEIKKLDTQKKTKQKTADAFHDKAQKVGLPKAENEETFAKVIAEAQLIRDNIDRESKQLGIDRDNLVIEEDQLKKKRKTAEEDLNSLRQRKTQIPESNIKLRARLLDALELKETTLPFVGELLKVNEKESAWEGAIERVLHSLGLSLLVPEGQYRRVCNYVDNTDLKGRLVYYSVPDDTKLSTRKIPENYLCHKVEIKSGTLFFSWIQNEINERYDFACCETIDEFQTQSKAITKQGQIKGSKYRHEKDDTRSLSDRKSYVLGWSNTEKIRAFELEIERLNKNIQDCRKKIEQQDGRKNELKTMDFCLHDLLNITSFSQINWKEDAKEIASWQEERERLEKSSDQLSQLKKRLRMLEGKVDATENKRSQAERQLGKLKNEMETYKKQLLECERITILLSEPEQAEHFPKLNAYLPETPISLGNIFHIQTNTRQRIEGIESEKSKHEKKLSESLIRRMQNYKNNYAAETVDADASIEAIREFRGFLKRIEEDDLPKLEEKFKKQLNDGVIMDMANFKDTLEKDVSEIKTKIRKINMSLRGIEYDAGTYIEINHDNSQDIEIRQFQIQLRESIEHTIGETDVFNEQKFERVKTILDRFNGGAQVDITWTNKVTDVRNWLDFSAAKKNAEDDTVKDFYSDSSGKSGGEREKLAYTILASALAFQFGLEWNQLKSRSFRFAVIDEAFGRGSDESTRYGLELFKRLNLQLLIITPLQKINIIENYVNAVHYVYKEPEGNSVVRNLTMHEYQIEKQKYLTQVGETV